MCLGVPGRIVEVFRDQDLLMAKIDFGGIYKKACLEYTPTAKTGDYVLVHVGFALAVVDELEAQQVFTFLKELNALDEIESGDEEVPGSQAHEIPS